MQRSNARTILVVGLIMLAIITGDWRKGLLLDGASLTRERSRRARPDWKVKYETFHLQARLNSVSPVGLTTSRSAGSSWTRAALQPGAETRALPARQVQERLSLPSRRARLRYQGRFRLRGLEEVRRRLSSTS